MFAKLIHLAPYEWVPAFMLSHFSISSFSLEQIMLELVLLGKLPVTNIYISYDFLMTACIVILWSLVVFTTYQIVNGPEESKPTLFKKLPL